MATRKIIAAEINYTDETTSPHSTGTLYYATTGFVSAAADTPASTLFEPRLNDNIRYKLQLTTRFWGNRPSKGIGEIRLLNVDGGLDSWLSDFNFRDHEIVISELDEGSAYSTKTILFRGDIERIDFRDEQEVRMVIREPATELLTPLVTDSFTTLSLTGSGPVLESYTANDNGGSLSTTLTHTAPSGIEADDILVILVANDSTTAGNDFTTTPTGWTKLGEDGDSTSDVHMAVFYKVADGTEGNVTITAGTSADMIGWYLRISGGDTSDPIDDSASQSLGFSASHACPSVTTTRDNALAIYAIAFDGADGDPFSEPSGWTEQDEQENGTSVDSVSGAFGTKTQVTAGATGVATVNSSAGDGSATWQVAIKTALIPVNVGIVKPFAFGNPKNCRCYLTDEEANKYEMSDAAPFNIDEVYIEGVAQSTLSPTFTVSGNGFTLSSAPNAQLTADITTDWSGSPQAADNSLLELTGVLTTKTGIAFDSNSPSTIATIDGLGYTYGLQFQSITGAGVLNKVAESIGGYWWLSRTGEVHMAQLKAPGTSVLTINDYQIVGDVKVTPDDAPGLSNMVGSIRNHHPYGEASVDASIASSTRQQITREFKEVYKSTNTLHSKYSHADGADPIPTLHTTAANAETEVDRWVALYSTRRNFYEIEVALETGMDTYIDNIGNTITVTDSRFGLGSGVDMVLTGVEGKLLDNTITLRLWA